MGIIKLFSADSYPDNGEEKTLPNPDPSNWKIIRHLETNGVLIVMINYPDCTNYEGNKILLYEDITLSELKDQKYIDPHFSENENFKSPIARFEPSSYGWILAKKLAESFGN